MEWIRWCVYVSAEDGGWVEQSFSLVERLRMRSLGNTLYLLYAYYHYVTCIDTFN